MKIITRKEAIEQGLPRYFTGIPCKHGHVCERTTGSAQCLQCRVINQRRCRSKMTPERKAKQAETKRKYIKENPEKVRQWEKNRDPEKRKASAKKKRKKYRETHPDYAREEYKRCRERILRYKKNYRSQNYLKVIEIERKSHRKALTKLADSYVKQTLTNNGSNLTAADIPQSLIEAKRAHLKLKRSIENADPQKPLRRGKNLLRTVNTSN